MKRKRPYSSHQFSTAQNYPHKIKKKTWITLREMIKPLVVIGNTLTEFYELNKRIYNETSVA